MRDKRSKLITTNDQNIQSRIFTLRGLQVMLDSDLAQLYGVETKVFNQAVKRNIERFPERFRFQLSEDEFQNLRSQFVTSSEHGNGKIKVFFCDNTLNTPLPPLAEVPTKWFFNFSNNIPSPPLYKSANERVLYLSICKL